MPDALVYYRPLLRDLEKLLHLSLCLEFFIYKWENENTITYRNIMN